MRADLVATQNDIDRLTRIADDIREFIHDSHGEDRRSYRTHLIVFEVLRDQATELKKTITQTHNAMVLKINEESK